MNRNTKKIHYYLFLSLILFFAACDEGGEEIVNMKSVSRTITISGITPSVGYAGEELTINGTDFGISKELVSAYVGEDKTEIISCEDQKLIVKVPEEATSGKISLIILGEKVTSEVMYTILDKPSITKIDPLHGFVGDQIAFIGSNLGERKELVTAVFAGVEEAASVVSCENEKIVVEVPTGAESGKITLQISKQKVNMPDEFVVLERATFKGITPKTGYRKSKVVLSGTNFGESTEGMVVRFGEKEATVLSCTNEQIEVTVPEDAAIGENAVSIQTKYEKIETTHVFEVLATPTVTSLSSDNGYVAAKITIEGTGFDIPMDAIKVLFGEQEAEIVSTTATTMVVKVPAPVDNHFGETEVVLTISDIEIYKGKFTIHDTPIVNSLASRLVKAGQTLIITGQRLNTASVKVLFGEIEVTPTNNTGTALQAIVPDNFEGGMVALKFDEIPNAIEIGEVMVMKPGKDITEYALKNYQHPFERVGDKYKSGEWAVPAIWKVENAALNPNEGGAPVGIQYISKKDDNTALAMQTDWGFPNSLSNGKIYQTTTLPAGKYKLTINVLELNVSGSAHLTVGRGEGIANTADIAGSVAYSAISQAGSLSMDFELSAQEEVSIGFVVTLTAKQRYVKINSFQLEVAE